jgi:hypothetical protein
MSGGVELDLDIFEVRFVVRTGVESDDFHQPVSRRIELEKQVDEPIKYVFNSMRWTSPKERFLASPDCVLIVISRRSREILSFYVAENARSPTAFEMTNRRQDKFSHSLAVEMTTRNFSFEPFETQSKLHEKSLPGGSLLWCYDRLIKFPIKNGRFTPEQEMSV